MKQKKINKEQHWGDDKVQRAPCHGFLESKDKETNVLEGLKE